MITDPQVRKQGRTVPRRDRVIKGKLPDHSVPSRTEKSNTWGKGNNKTPRADDATEKPTQEPYSCFSREHFRREKDIRKRKPDLELSALNSLIPLDSNGYKEETSISFQTTLPVVAPVSHSTPSPVLEWGRGPASIGQNRRWS